MYADFRSYRRFPRHQNVSRRIRLRCLLLNWGAHTVRNLQPSRPDLSTYWDLDDHSFFFFFRMYMLSLFEMHFLYILKMLKIQTKMLCISPCSMCSWCGFEKKITFYVACIKFIKFEIKISLFATYFFVFFAEPTKNFRFSQNYTWAYRLWRCICGFFSNFFNILKYIFRLKEAYTPRIKTAFPDWDELFTALLLIWHCTVGVHAYEIFIVGISVLQESPSCD
jgi:hypothetical protein